MEGTGWRVPAVTLEQRDVPWEQQLLAIGRTSSLWAGQESRAWCLPRVVLPNPPGNWWGAAYGAMLSRPCSPRAGQAAWLPDPQGLAHAYPHALILQDEGALISEIPDIANRDGRATDEEKLASTTSAQKPAGLEKKGEPEDDLEYFECSNVPVPAAKHSTETGKSVLAARCDVRAARQPRQPPQPLPVTCCWRGNAASPRFIYTDWAKGCCKVQ